MTMKNTVFVNGLVKSREKYLIGRDKFIQMADAANDVEAFRLLSETGFGGEAVSGAAPSDYETLISAEWKALMGFLKQYAPNENFVRAVAARNDFHNAECAVRSVYAEVAVTAFMPDGVVDKSLLLSAAHGEKTEMPQYLLSPMKQALELFEAGEASGVDVSLIFLRAYYSFMLKTAAGSVWKENVAFEIDAKNVCAALRSNGEKGVEKQYIDGGKISVKTLSLIASGEKDKALDKLLRTPYYDFVKSAFEEKAASLALVDTERRAESFAMEKLKEKRFETEGSVPLLVYVNYKLCEMKNVRVVMALKRCRADKDKIIARLVDCYAG